jgi:hypothetical protein
VTTLEAGEHEAKDKPVAYGPIFLLGDLRDTFGPLFLHAEGVTIAPGAEAQVYLMDNAHGTGPETYVGAIKHDAKTPRRISFLVRDFEEGDRKYTPRASLRATAMYGVNLVVTHGKVKVERFVLTTDPRPGGEADRRR